MNTDGDSIVPRIIKKVYDHVSLMPELSSESRLVALLLESGFVDPDFYQRRYPDIKTNGLSGTEYFINYGYKEGHIPASWLSPVIIAELFKRNPKINSFREYIISLYNIYIYITHRNY